MSVIKAFRYYADVLEFVETTPPTVPYSIVGPLKGTSHPYDMIREPAVGDELSYAFNGDCYPCGTVTRVTKTKCETSDGTVFRRLKNGRWKKDQMWSMVFGHIYEQNPCF